MSCLGLVRVQEHRSFPSIVAYIVFNEGWGQYETDRVTRLAQSLDASRLCDPASGWVDAPVRIAPAATACNSMHAGPCLLLKRHPAAAAALLGTFCPLCLHARCLEEVLSISKSDRGLHAGGSCG